MKNPQHTPGPWSFDHNSIGSDWIAILNSPMADDSVHIANVRYQKDQTQAANAALIAAAPELLEALIEVEQMIHSSELNEGTMEVVRNAISRAIIK